MTKEVFQEKRIKGRKELLEKIVQTFITLHPLAIHQFGSGTTGFTDELSDIDIWITFKGEDISDILPKLGSIFQSIAPVLVRHYSKSWSPVGGSANSVIHDTGSGPYIVDYYISKASETVLKPDFKVLYGEDTFKRGEWRLNKEVDKNIHDTHTLRSDIDLLLSLIFISIKGIVRQWDDDTFVKTLRTVHSNFRKRHPGKIKRRQINLSYRSDYRLLGDLYRIANKRQRRAILKIRKYMKQVEAFYYRQAF